MKPLPSWERRKWFKAGCVCVWGMEPKQVQTVKKAVWFEWMLSWASVGRQSCSALDVLGHLDLQVLVLI